MATDSLRDAFAGLTRTKSCDSLCTLEKNYREPTQLPSRTTPRGTPITWYIIMWKNGEIFRTHSCIPDNDDQLYVLVSCDGKLVSDVHCIALMYAIGEMSHRQLIEFTKQTGIGLHINSESPYMRMPHYVFIGDIPHGSPVCNITIPCSP